MVEQAASLDAIRNPAHLYDLTEPCRRIPLFHQFQGLGIDAKRLRFTRSPR